MFVKGLLSGAPRRLPGLSAQECCGATESCVLLALPCPLSPHLATAKAAQSPTQHARSPLRAFPRHQKPHGDCLTPNVHVTCSVAALTARTAGPQTLAAAMRVVREYINLYVRNSSYVPPALDIGAMLQHFEEYTFEHCSDRALDIFCVLDLKCARLFDAQEFITLDCRVLATQAKSLLSQQPVPGPKFLDEVCPSAPVPTLQHVPCVVTTSAGK